MLQTKEFRRIYTREYARVYMLTSLQEDAMMEDQDQPSKSVELIFTSAPGSATLKWELYG